MEALTNGKTIAIAAHNQNYWSQDKSYMTSEAFAHMFECQFDKKDITK